MYAQINLVWLSSNTWGLGSLSKQFLPTDTNLTKRGEGRKRKRKSNPILGLLENLAPASPNPSLPNPVTNTFLCPVSSLRFNLLSNHYLSLCSPNYWPSHATPTSLYLPIPFGLQHTSHSLEPMTQCGPWTGSTGVMWAPCQNVGSPASPQL